MRRPVKPFVTEYKGTNRRPGPRGGDDLFGAPAASEGGSRRSGEAGGSGENAYEAAMKAADAVFSPAPGKAREAEDAPQAGGSPAEPADGPASGGRILRAMDEPPPPEPAEAEEAPRRRGRKPGSKNRPKVAAVEAAPLPPIGQEDEEDSEFEDDGEVEAAAPAAPVRATVPYRSRKTDRFPWVRTKLKPGEQWKRRLPKVCW